MAISNIYELNRSFWDFAFDNPEMIKPNHCAIYYFALEHCNRLGWKEKFGFPTSMVMEATGIKSYSVYKKAFDELVEFGFINVIEYSRNQHSSNIVALKENNKARTKANDKALDKALSKHNTMHVSNQVEYNNTIIQDTSLPITNKQLITSVVETKVSPIIKTKRTIEERKKVFYDKIATHINDYSKEMLRDFFEYWSEHGEDDHKMKYEKQKSFDINLRLKKWNNNNFNSKPNGTNNKTQPTADEKLNARKAANRERLMGKFGIVSEQTEL